MQRRREIFSRHKTIKDINEDSGMSSRDLHSVDSDSYVKGMHEESLSERVRNICIQSEKPPHSMPQMPTPTANRRPTFSLPRIFTQKKKDVVPLAVPHLPSAADTVSAPVTSLSMDEHQQQPQLSPGTTTTTTSAYNTGVDTGQESPPANTKKQCSTVNTVSRTTVLGGRSTVGAGGGGGAETTTTMTTTVPHPSMLPTLTPAAGARQATRKQHVRFKSDSVSCLPQAVFYTSAERLAETIATQQRMLHQELSISDFPHQQQQNQTGCLMMKQQNHQIQNNGTAQQKQLVQPKSTSNLQLEAQYTIKNQPQKQQQQFVQNPNSAQKLQKVQQQQQQYYVQPAQSYQQQQLQPYPNHNIPWVNPQSQIPQYPKDITTTTLRYNPKNNKNDASGQNEKQYEAQTNPQTGSLRRQQQQRQMPIRYLTPAANEQQQQQKHQQLQKVGKILSMEEQQLQLQYAGTSMHSTQQQQRQQQYLPIADNTKMMSLHRADKRMTAEDVLLIGHQQKHHSGANLPTSSVCSGIATRWQCSKLAQNLPRPDWPRGTELAELFAFKPTAAIAFGHNKQQQHQPQLKQQQQREKRRGSPSKQISGQHRQQPELEWVIKRRPDGTRYVTRRPARKRTTPSLLAAVKARREQSLARERAGMSTTDDDGGSEAVANAGVIPKWWAQRTKRKPPPIPSAFSPSSLARKKPPTASDGGGTLIQVVPSDLQKAFTVTTV
ncbi:hypothetical protein niasHS_005487 [Heterodera schachtii]|uniref:Uncharacterized protein n=1 Tax=Heterodera schachtii TaxID=97005 RepID=A0ABD2JIW9_HETSC